MDWLKPRHFVSQNGSIGGALRHPGRFKEAFLKDFEAPEGGFRGASRQIFRLVRFRTGAFSDEHRPYQARFQASKLTYCFQLLTGWKALAG